MSKIPNKSITYRFASIDKMLAHLKAKYGKDLEHSPYQGGTPWTNNETLQESVSLAIRGTTEYQELVENELAKLNNVKTPHADRMDMDVVGSTCSPGAYISGHPRCMWRQQKSPNPEPVRIHALMNATASVTVEQFAKRGAMIVALLRKLENVVPVELWIVFSTPSRIKRNDANVTYMFKAQTAPLDIRRLSYQLASVGFFRNVGASLVESNGHGVTFGPCATFNGVYGYEGNNMITRRKYIAGYKEALGLNERDIVFPRMTPDEGIHVETIDVNEWLNEIAASVTGMEVASD